MVKNPFCQLLIPCGISPVTKFVKSFGELEQLLPVLRNMPRASYTTYLLGKACMKHESLQIMDLEDQGQIQHLKSPADDNLELDLQRINALHDCGSVSLALKQDLGIFESLVRCPVKIGNQSAEFR